jgi:GH18 family chitinase
MPHVWAVEAASFRGVFPLKTRIPLPIATGLTSDHAKVVFSNTVIGMPFCGCGWAGVRDIDHGLFQPASGPIYSPATGIFWAYDNPRVARTKATYVRRRDLGGVMFWELSGDDAEGSLVKSLSRALR